VNAAETARPCKPPRAPSNPLARHPRRHRTVAPSATPQAPPVSRSRELLPASAVRARRVALPARVEAVADPSRDLQVRTVRVRSHLEDVVERGGSLGRRRILRRRSSISRFDVEQRWRPRQLDGGHRSSDSARADLSGLACRPSRRLVVRMGRHKDRVQPPLSLGREPQAAIRGADGVTSSHRVAVSSVALAGCEPTSRPDPLVAA
jgi:hypothetical protein